MFWYVPNGSLAAGENCGCGNAILILKLDRQAHVRPGLMTLWSQMNGAQLLSYIRISISYFDRTFSQVGGSWNIVNFLYGTEGLIRN